MITAQERSRVLVEALPWLQRFHNKIVVIKFGGNAMVNRELKMAFAEDLLFLRMCGVKVVVTHGGGPQISAALERAGIESEFRGGLRVTSQEAMSIVRDVLIDEVRAELVNLINRDSPIAIGLSGEDGQLFTAERRGVVIDGIDVDLGLVGDVVAVEPAEILASLNEGKIPVITSVAFDSNRQLLNVNADTAAAALARALKAEKLVILTDVEGLYRNWPESKEIVSTISINKLRDMLPSLESGMIPKMEACLRAVEGGVAKAHVIDGRVPHSVLLELATNEGIGTEVVA